MKLPSLSIVIFFITPILSYSQLNFADEAPITLKFIGEDLKLADVNGDGYEDLVTINVNQYLAWSENDGAGDFSNLHIVDEGLNISAINTKDIDLDGDEDIIGASHWDDNIFLYENLGDGEFSERQIIASVLNARIVEILDLNEDGILDIIVGGYNGISGNVIWLPGLGNGEFDEAINIGSSSGITFLRIADMNNDGFQDVMFPSGSGIRLYENLGDNTFDGFTVIPTSSYPEAIDIIDFNSNGNNDILCTTSSNGGVGIFLNNGNAEFTEEVITNENYDCRDVELVDMDNDNDLDLLVSASFFENDDYSNSVLLFENLGGEVFNQDFITLQNGQITSSIEIADFNGDGYQDVATNSEDGRTVEVLLNSGSGAIAEIYSITNFFISIDAIAVGDLNSDGNLDVVGVGRHDKIRFYEGNGNGGFENGVALNENSYASEFIEVLDLDGDGVDDVLFSDYVPDEQNLYWLRNTGEGDFAPAQTISDIQALWTSVSAADLDSDGDLDLVGTGYYDDIVVWIEQTAPGIFATASVLSESMESPSASAIEDIDNDGDLDILVVSRVDDKLSLFENNGDGSFADEFVLSNECEQAIDISLSDVDLDGDLDVLAACSDDNNLRLFYNNGDADFNQPIVVASYYATLTSAQFVDLNGDDYDDIAFTSYWSNELVVVQNNGDGTFGLPQSIASNQWTAENVAHGDADNDGDQDLFSASLSAAKISFFENLLEEGCTDQTAINYDPGAVFDDGTCCFEDGGCTDTEAYNYNINSTCDNGSCLYQVSGIAFFDQNNDGVFNIFQGDYPLQNLEVTLEPLSWTAWTNTEGVFSFFVPEGAYAVTADVTDLFPYYTTVPQVNFSAQSQTSVLFGFGSDFTLNDISTELVSSANGYPCDDLVEHSIFIQNEGNAAFSGYAMLELDEQFQAYEEITPIDSVVNGLIYMGFDNLGPQQSLVLNIQLHTPTVDQIGEFISSSVEVVAIDDQGNILGSTFDVLVIELTCAYDPNDKQVFPIGYEQPGFVRDTTQLEYLIRFQNTGNAEATDVLVTDTISNELDLNSFEFVASSHSVQVSLKPEERALDFFFENIMLPDSTSNEPDSHGFIQFKINPQLDLEHGTELRNSANIYFDSNPPIITNTTLNTVYECTDELAQIANESNVYCSSQVSFLENAQEYVEEYTWLINDEIVDANNPMEYVFEPGFSYEVVHLASNPLCEAMSVINFDFVDEEVISSFSANGNVLMANPGASYQWYLYGIPIEGATDQVYEIIASGSYSVEVFNDVGCSEISEEQELFFTDIAEYVKVSDLKVFPNPSSEEVSVISSIVEGSIQIYDLNARLLLSEEFIHSIPKLNVSSLSPGIYQLRVVSEKGEVHSARLLVHSE